MRPGRWSSMGRTPPVLVIAGALLPACGLFDHARVPGPERALASEGIAAPEAAEAGRLPNPAPGTPGGRGRGRGQGDDEPELLPSSDEPGDADADEPEEPAPPGPAPDPGSLAIASRYAALDRAACEAELDRRQVPYQRVAEARGVVAPLRLTGPVSGVTFRSGLSAAQRKTATIEIFDCRLVLALDDFAKLLAKHDVVEVIHMSVYRPVSTKVTLKGAGRRHGGALAIDAGFFKTKDGKTLSVEKDFHGRIGARPCPAPAAASELRHIACEAHDARLFNVLLTPDYNRAHRNHFHMEVTAGVRWTLVR